MKLYAISDLHLANPDHRQVLEVVPSHPEDWLILAGDMGETEGHLIFALLILTCRFQRLLWVPGNHDLWTLPSDRSGLRGEAKYQQLVSICRDHGVLTPEDPYVLWEGEGSPHLLVPVFLLYDYSYRPDHVPTEYWPLRSRSLWSFTAIYTCWGHSSVTACVLKRSRFAIPMLKLAQFGANRSCGRFSQRAAQDHMRYYKPSKMNSVCLLHRTLRG